MNDLEIDLARNTPWVDMSACVKFGLDRPSRLAGHTEQTNRQTNRQNIGFYYIDLVPCRLSTDPKYVTLNDFEWLEWPFYVIYPLLRTATGSLFVAYLVPFVYHTWCEERRSAGSIANSDPQSGSVFGIRGQSADLPWTLYRRNINK